MKTEEGVVPAKKFVFSQRMCTEAVSLKQGTEVGVTDENEPTFILDSCYLVFR